MLINWFKKYEEKILIFLMLLAVLVFFEPRIIDQLALLKIKQFLIAHRIIAIFRYITFIFFTVYYLYINNYKLNSSVKLTLLFILFVCVSTFFNKGDFFILIAIMYQILFFVLIAEITIINNQIYEFNKIVFCWTGILIIINFITAILMPEGLYKDLGGWTLNWIFGNYQQNVTVFIPAIVSGAFVNHYNKSFVLKILYYLLIGVMLVTTILNKSMTTLMMFFGLCVLIINFKFNLCEKLYENAKVYFVSIITSILLVVFRIHFYFNFIIEKVFKKNLSLSGRVQIWDKSILFIKQHPIIGIGIQSRTFDETVFRIGTRPLKSPHNEYLYLLYIGGIFLFFIFSYISIKSLRINFKFINLKISKIVFIGISAYLVLFITETWTTGLRYYFLLLTYGLNMERIIKNKKGEINDI